MFNVEPRNRLFDRATSADSSSADDTRVTGMTPDVAPAPIPSILIVEDEGIVAQDLNEALSRLGYRIAGIASEGTQAGQAARVRSGAVWIEFGHLSLARLA